MLASYLCHTGDLRSHVVLGRVLRTGAQHRDSGDLAQSPRRVPGRDGRPATVRHPSDRTGLQTRGVLRRPGVVGRAVRAVASLGLPSARAGRLPDAPLRVRGQLRRLIWTGDAGACATDDDYE